MKEDGWDVLTMEEKRFTMLDRVLRPDLYVWMKGSECFSNSTDCPPWNSYNEQSGGRALRKENIGNNIHWGPILVPSFARGGAMCFLLGSAMQPKPNNTRKPDVTTSP